MTLIGVTVVMLYASRAGYNLIVLTLSDVENINSFDYDWYNVSDQVRRTCPSSPSPIISSALLIFTFTPPGGPEVLAGRRRLRGVRGHPVHLGAAAHLTGGLFLPCPATSTGTGERSCRGHVTRTC